MAPAGLGGVTASQGDLATRGVPEPRLVRAAREFEAQMMKELLRPMARSSALLEEGDDEETGILGDFASESLAGALSAGGGFGIAARIVHELSRSGNRSANPPVIGNPQINTGMSADK